MQRNQIFQKVVESADRFGAQNPQQLRFLESLLTRSTEEEAFLGLLAVFVECPRDDRRFQRQKLAGRLLAKTKPGFPFELESTVRAVLPNYSGSVEELPQHFAHVHGLAAVLAALEEIEREGLTEQERSCRNAQRRWLTGDADRLKAKYDDDWVALKGPFTAADVRGLELFGDVDRLSVTDQPLLTASLARGFGVVKSVRRFWLWCDVTRTAMRHVIAMPGLEVLDVLQLRRPGRLEGFSAATALQEFRCHYCLSEPDLLEIASCGSLREIGAKSANLTPRAMDALLELRGLEALDLAQSKFNDAFAARVSASKSLQSLNVGGTRLTRKGLEQISGMKQLRSLDIWATGIAEADLDLLAEMPNLEYLSVGYVDGEGAFNAGTLLPRLYAIASLKRIWLDGVKLSTEAKRELAGRYESVSY